MNDGSGIGINLQSTTAERNISILNSFKTNPHGSYKFLQIFISNQSY